MPTLSDLSGSTWSGSAELWLDPLGNEASPCSCTATVTEDGLRYAWSHDGTPHEGRLALDGAAGDFTDTFHAAKGMRCQVLAGARGLLQLEGSYGPDDDWGWRIGVFLRAPTEELVLQMTNIAPWGEEARAVRMVFRPMG